MKVHKPLLLTLFTVAALSAGTIDYRFATGTNTTTSSFDFGGVTVTGGPGQIFINVSNGLGIIGGSSDLTVDPGEFLTFTFDGGPAFNIVGQVNNVLITTATLEAFGTGGSLGQQAISTQSGTPINVSALYGNVPIVDFTLTGVTGNYRFDTLDFSTPEPSTWALLLAGMGVLVALRRRQLAC